ncbi:MAG: TldD/PmbA family protein, partial [Deltaproteobacteria bacterium]|nr:TldD/PmbA family protein [Nannocystaceae bacterium]
LRELVQRAEAHAALAPVDPEAVGALGPVKPMRVSARDPRVASMTASARADIVGEAIETGKAAGLEVSGFLQHGDVAEAFADRGGLFVHHGATDISLTVTCRTPDGTGSSKGGFRSHSRTGLSGKQLAARVADAAKRSRDPKPIEPGRYRVLLMPDAVAELLDFMVDQMGARAATEGRSFFAKPGGGTKLSDPVFDPRVSLWSDPADKRNPSSPLAEDGRPQLRTQWVDKGVVKALHADRDYAQLAGVPATPRPSSIHMQGDDVGFDALLAKLDRGVLVTRLWYNRMLDPRGIVATGLTRDGTFWVEGGKVVHPVKNLRYNDSPVALLTRLVALGKPERAGMVDGRVWVVPPVVVDGFSFESTSDAI